MSEDSGVVLTGGNSNAPVRYGDRVHRAAGPWTPAVHDYLRHLRSRGVDVVPEPFGFDAQGREVLEFLPGDVPVYPLPELVLRERFLVDAAVLLRRLHDASVDLEATDRVWQQPARQPAEVISVNDYAPYNLVVRDGRIAGVIDLDQAAPGPRVRDLAHLAYRLAPLGAPEHLDGRPAPAPERARRLAVLATAYAGDRPVEGTAAADVLAAVPGLLHELALHADGAGRPDHGDVYRADRLWLDEHADEVRPHRP